MKKILLLVISFNLISNLFAQEDTLICYDQSVPKISFKGKAPHVWKIDGSVKDWKTILGPFTGDNHMPFYPPRASGFNWARDGWTLGEGNGMPHWPDVDNPSPDRDLIFHAFTNDDYNVYFYFRRLDNKNSTNSFFYFCDLNADGYMKLGEPVFYGSFNKDSILSLSVGIFIPDTTRGDPQNPQPPYIPGIGNDMSGNFFVGGYQMPGKVRELFNSKFIPRLLRLKKNEVFSGAVTENGYGVEFAVPWRYFRNWLSLNRSLTPADVFAYRIAIQKGDGEYIKANVVDDANNCCNSLAVSDNTDVSNTVSVTELDPGLSYRFDITYTNPKSAVERIGIENILLSNLHYTSDQKPLLRNIRLRTSSDSDCNGKFDNFTYPFNDGGNVNFNLAREEHDTTRINFSDSLDFGLGSYNGPAVQIPPHQKGCFIVHLTVPPTMSLLNSNIDFNASVRYYLHQIYDPCQDGGGGRTINPVGKAKTKIGGGNGFSVNSFTDNSIDNNLNNSEVQVYPNPNNGSFIISLPAGESVAKVSLYDALARNVKQWHQFNSNAIKVNNIKSGIYFLKVIYSSGKTITKKVIVEK